MAEPDDEVPTPQRRFRAGPRPTRSSARRGNRGRTLIIVAVGAIFMLFTSARGIASFITDILWFDSLGFGSVFFKILRVKIGLAVAFSLLSTLAVLVNVIAAERMAPTVVGNSPEEVLIQRYREMMRRGGRKLRLLFALIFGLVAGVPVSGEWRSWLLFTNGSNFGVKDPLYSRDAGFYVFQLPFIAFLLDWVFAIAVVVVLITAAAHYLNGGIRLQTGGRRVTAQVKLHLSLLLAALALIKAAGYWFNRYRLLSSTRGYVDGAGYTDVKAQLPAIQLLMLISLLAAVLLVVNVWQRGWRLPIISVGLWAVVAVVAGEMYPAVIQRFQVQPAESRREVAYIDRNIDATRLAYGLDNVQVASIAGTTPTGAELSAASDAVRRARVLDGTSVADAFKNLQGLSGYYQFNDAATGAFDVDRYPIAGVTTPVVIGVRELNPKGVQATWENTHLIYTHGYGVAVAQADTVTAEGQPRFLPLEGALKLDQPQVYVGEDMSGYAVVRTERDEIDGNNQSFRYSGTGGVGLASTIRQIAFALRFGEWNLYASSLINSQSRIIYRRDIRERLQAVAPFLKFDSDPHAVVSNGRIVWVVDAYTTSDRFPYSQRVDTGDLPARSDLRGERFNYVRNSVKATVDAYDGAISLYLIDPADPVARTYQKVFPGLLKPASAIPEGLAAHFRYPLDLFRIQSEVWGRYRVDDAARFYQRGDDTWNVAQNPPARQASSGPPTTSATATTVVGQVVVENKETRVPPYYSLFPTGDGGGAEFNAVRSFVPFSPKDDRRELAAYMTASSEPGSYGRLRVVELSTRPNGPFIVASKTSQDFSRELSLLDAQGSTVLFGDLQLIPVGQGVVWTRPWFLLASGSTNIPKLDSVTVTIGDTTYRGLTLELALQQAATGIGALTTTPVSPSSTPGGSSTPGSSPEALIAEAEQLRREADAALKKSPPDLNEYRDKLTKAYEKAAEAARLALGKPIVVAPSTTVAAAVPTTTAKA